MTKLTRATSQFWVGAGASPGQEVILNPADDEAWLQDSAGGKSMKRMVRGSGGKSGKNLWMSSPSSKVSDLKREGVIALAAKLNMRNVPRDDVEWNYLLSPSCRCLQSMC